MPIDWHVFLEPLIQSVELEPYQPSQWAFLKADDAIRRLMFASERSQECGLVLIDSVTM